LFKTCVAMKFVVGDDDGNPTPQWERPRPQWKGFGVLPRIRDWFPLLPRGREGKK